MDGQAEQSEPQHAGGAAGAGVACARRGGAGGPPPPAQQQQLLQPPPKHQYRPPPEQQESHRGSHQPPRAGRGGGSRYPGHAAERSGSPAGRSRRDQQGPSKSLQPTGEREKGFVTSLRDSYGFVSSAERSGEVFFHVTEVQKPEGKDGEPADLTALLCPGCEVEFIVQHNPRNNKPNAKAIVILPPGTIKMQEVGMQEITGVVVKECQVTSRRGGTKENAFGLLRLDTPAEPSPAVDENPQAGEAAELTAASAAVPETLMFELGDVVGGRSPAVGSQAKFLIATHIRSKQRRAVQVEVTAPTPKLSQPAEREMGVVVTVKESFGFIRPVNQKQEVFFHFSELPQGAQVRVGSAVSYNMQFSHKTKRDVGVNVEILEDGSLPLCPPQTMKGIVNIPSNGSTGMLLFRDAQLFEQTCSYTDGDVDPLPDREDVQLCADDEVQFEAHLNLQTLNYSASKVTLLRRAVGAVEFGQVNLIKGNFGFIKCCSRPSDVFFHLSSLKGGLDAQTIAVGTNVQFRVMLDKGTGKLNGVEVAPAPEGAVLFEKVEEEELRGHIVERSFARGTAGTGGMAGLIQYTDDAGSPQRITFVAADVIGSNPKPGDPVSFKIAINLRAAVDALRSTNPRMAAHGARRAVQITVIRHAGTVLALVGSFGFIEYTPVPINVKEIEAKDPTDGIPGRKGQDSVTGTDFGAEAAPIANGVEVGPSQPLGAVSSAQDYPAEGVEGHVAERDELPGLPNEPATAPPSAAAAAPLGKGAAVATEEATEEASGAPENGTAGEGAAAEGDSTPAKATNDRGASPGSDGPAAEQQPPSGATEGSAASAKDKDKRPSKRKKALRRIFFHSSEVADNVVLGVGDEVEFTVVINAKSQDFNACHVVRTKEAPQRPLKYKQRAGEEEQPSGTPPVRAPREVVKRPTVHQPVMPDTTRGFTFGRGKGLEGIEHPPLGLRPPPPPPEPEPKPADPPPPKLKTRTKKAKAQPPPAVTEAAPLAVQRSSSSQLNVEAPPFVPGSL
eukprot:CAMPEP_0117662406 /NCGR_PEP_ID=MMETSP0804-20121206/8037_1 /TAXON_ID=1074897 /ORGANISM="Tetraselmis astigmatica, Strain CCMP880" /LENGTH=1011 /DNA_ID=CAMNT_0005469305 /DNA_START=465 /DNA_END=3501 /DNA_ORIENTATION=+